MRRWVPFRRATIRQDAVAGLVLGVQSVPDGLATGLLAGVNLPMLLRAVTYRHEPLEATTQRALAGGTQGIMPVAVTAPQNQARRAPNDQGRHDHQQ